MMKFLTLTTVLFASAVHADDLSKLGLDDPVVTPPARVSGDWDGPYVGLSYGRNKASSETADYTEQCRKVLDGTDHGIFPCNDKIFDQYPESKVIEKVSNGTVASKTSSDDFGAFVGWRKDWGTLVGGVELGHNGGISSAEVQAGLDLNRVLVYGFVGAGSFESESGTVFGVGADAKVGNKGVFVGAKYMQGEFGEVQTDSALLRVGIQF